MGAAGYLGTEMTYLQIFECERIKAGLTKINIF